MSLVKELGQFSWMKWNVMERNQDCWTVLMAVELKRVMMKILPFTVNNVSYEIIYAHKSCVQH